MLLLVGIFKSLSDFQLQLDNQKRKLQNHGHGNRERIDNLVARVHGNEQRIGTLSKNITNEIALLESQVMRNISSLSSTIITDVLTDISTLSSKVSGIDSRVSTLSNSTKRVSSRLSNLSSEAGLQKYMI